MSKEQELNELMEAIAELRKDKDWDLFCEAPLGRLSDLLCSDEVLARKFFTECTDEEFDLAYLSFEDLARVYGKSFIRWLAINAAQRDLDIDDWFEMHVAMAEVDLIPADPHWSDKTPEERRRIVLDAIHKLEAEAE